MEDLNIAAVCMHAEPGRIERNLERVRRFSLEAGAHGADVVCFPELCVTGYVLKEPEQAYGGADWRHAEKQLVDLAREAGLLIIVGLIETAGAERPYITQLAVGAQGLIGKYRKTHLSPLERGRYRAGESLEIFSFGKAAFGIQLCYEVHFPEISTVMAIKGAEVLFIPHASPRGDGEQKLSSWMRHLPGRAFDNGVFVVATNQVGETEGGLDFPGAAVVLGPDGREYAHYAGKEEKIVYARLRKEDLNSVRRHRMRYFLPWRRPELYRILVEERLREAKSPSHAT